MWFSSWLQKRTVSPKSCPARRFRPGLEVLEDRAVPATFLVNTTDDILGHDDGMLSLRQAILDANASHGADTIVLPAAVSNYTLTRDGINEDAALSGDLDITGDLKIKGAGAGATIVDAAGLDRVFHVLGGADVTISGLTIQGGVVSDLDGNGSGGGIFNSGTLTVRDSMLSGNSTDLGGGIYNSGTLTVRDSTLTDNSADQGGGIGNDYGTLTVSNSTLSGNSGGGIWNYVGTLTVSDTTLYGNSVTYYGGGIANFYGTLTVYNSTLCGNSGDSGGGIFNDSSEMVTVSNSNISGNSAIVGGGIFNSGSGTLTITDSTLSGNSADQGGAIYNDYFTFDYDGTVYIYSGTVTVRDSTFKDNTATEFGGGIANLGTLTSLGLCMNGSPGLSSGGRGAGNIATDFGGGIANFGTLTVKGSTLLGNTAPLGGDLQPRRPVRLRQHHRRHVQRRTLRRGLHGANGERRTRLLFAVAIGE